MGVGGEVERARVCVCGFGEVDPRLSVCVYMSFSIFMWRYFITSCIVTHWPSPFILICPGFCFDFVFFILFFSFSFFDHVFAVVFRPKRMQAILCVTKALFYRGCSVV